MKRRPTTSRLLRRLNRSAMVDLIRTEGVASPSSLAERLNISIPTVMRVIEDLIAEDLVAYDGFDEANVRGRPRARIKFRGAAHAIAVIIERATAVAFTAERQPTFGVVRKRRTLAQFWSMPTLVAGPPALCNWSMNEAPAHDVEPVTPTQSF